MTQDLQNFYKIDLSKKSINYLSLTLAIEKSKITGLYLKGLAGSQAFQDRLTKVDILSAEIAKRKRNIGKGV